MTIFRLNLHLYAFLFYFQIKFGVPALLIYKNGDLVGNFVKLGDEFGNEFDENDVEDFLVEYVCSLIIYFPLYIN